MNNLVVVNEIWAQNNWSELEWFNSIILLLVQSNLILQLEDNKNHVKC